MKADGQVAVVTLMVVQRDSNPPYFPRENSFECTFYNWNFRLRQQSFYSRHENDVIKDHFIHSYNNLM